MDNFSNFPAIPHRGCENRDIWISPNRVWAEWMRWVCPWRSSGLRSSVGTGWAGEKNTRVIHLRMKMGMTRMHTYSYIHIWVESAVWLILKILLIFIKCIC